MRIPSASASLVAGGRHHLAAARNLASHEALMIGFDRCKVVEVVDHDTQRFAQPRLRMVGAQVDAFQARAVVQMKARYRIAERRCALPREKDRSAAAKEALLVVTIPPSPVLTRCAI